MNISTIELIKNTRADRFFLLAGPCVIENDQNPFEIAEKLVSLSNQFDIPLIFKGSYKKANRSRIDSFSGIGDLKALHILHAVGKQFDIPVVTDIHSEQEAALAAEYVDVLQIPAFLCRQTELLIAAAKTGKVVNIKKGQFLSGKAMRFAVDYRNISDMKSIGVPVIMDITHSLQQPNQESGVTGGKPELIGLIAKAAIATGADGIFLETHPNPAVALSDGANMLKLDFVEALLEKLVRIKEAVV
jgi:2-dehydro-3-deoxyphosphooctonate aldolase (KDO 8-P synthase)